MPHAALPRAARLSALIVVAALLFPYQAGANDSADAAKDAVRNIGQDGREFGLGVAKAAKETGQAIGQGARSAAQDVSKGFRRDFIEGGAFKGTNRPAQPVPGVGDAP